MRGRRFRVPFLAHLVSRSCSSGFTRLLQPSLRRSQEPSGHFVQCQINCLCHQHSRASTVQLPRPQCHQPTEYEGVAQRFLRTDQPAPPV